MVVQHRLRVELHDRAQHHRPGGFAVLYRLYKTRDTGRRSATRKDPVCGMQVEKEHAPATAVVAGQPYWFCSDHCKHRFDAEPDPATLATHSSQGAHS